MIGGANFSNADLSGAKLEKVSTYVQPKGKITVGITSFNNAKLAGANLSYAYLSWASFNGADMKGAKLRYACLSNSSKPWQGMNDIMKGIKGLPKVRLGNFRPPGASVSSTDLTGADLSYSDLRNVNLTGAKLRGAKMIGILSNYETLLPEVILDKRSKKETRE